MMDGGRTQTAAAIAARLDRNSQSIGKSCRKDTSMDIIPCHKTSFFENRHSIREMPVFLSSIQYSLTDGQDDNMVQELYDSIINKRGKSYRSQAVRVTGSSQTLTVQARPVSASSKSSKASQR